MPDNIQRNAPAITSPVNDPTQQQRTASNPSVSAWVNASAGSGKTKVLTDRILRLLLPREDGAPGTIPSRILALTFTKAGANEMAIRLSKRLADWAVFDDASLSADMEKNLLGRAPTRQEQDEARKLFARVVDTPGGLNIMTIHSFCQSVLGRFPIEAGLPPGFVPLEEGDARELMAKARDEILSHAHTHPLSPLANAINHLGQLMNEEQIDQLLTALNAERHQLKNIVDRAFGIDGVYANLCILLGIDQGRDLDDITRDFFGISSPLDLPSLCPALAASKSEKEKGKAIVIQAFWEYAPFERPAAYSSYRENFLTTEGQIRKTLLTKPVIERNPTLLEMMEKEAQRLQDFENQQKAYLCATLTRDALLFGQNVLDEYSRLKAERGALDFEDLILKTLALFKGETFQPGKDVVPWILYKLDEGLEHILVDEAQDTNPEQWEIIQRLSTEFFTGEDAHETRRTMFVVGDEKQSIFSFQRAAPDKFRDMFKWYEQRIGESGQAFVPVPINTSFRSVQLILDVVDTVFAERDVSLSLSQEYRNHFAFRAGQPGCVEIWPLFRDKSTGEEKNKDDGQTSLAWDIPATLQESQSGAWQMAEKIGDTIKHWIDHKVPLQTYDRPIQAGDILILVKSRSAFVPQLVRALKLRAIAVSGIDRMILSEQLVVEDLCAAAAFALLPDDDLTLASFLKSPFVGWDEERLYRLAQGRENQSLWNRIRLSGDGILTEWLTGLIEHAGIDHPYEFFSRLIQSPCPADENSGFHAIKNRLGEDAIDPLDEFLNLALAYERKHTASLQGFLKWHEEGKSEIKRQMEEGGGAVRIMTVHGAKGLQAPIVFLPDTIRTSSSKPDRILWPHKTGLPLPVLSASKANVPESIQPAFRTIQEQEDEEYRRLLYVAMTRAEERLYIGGYKGKKGPAADSETVYWYKDVRRAFESLPDVEQLPSGILDEQGIDEPILRLESKSYAPPDKQGKEIQASAAQDIALPAFFRKAPAAEPFPPRPLVPSRPSDQEPHAWSPLATSDPYRFRRGTITHRLLQTLPDIQFEKREDVAKQFVTRMGADLPVSTRDGIVQETLAILNDPVFAKIFGPGSLAEIPVTGYLEEGVIISGQIDRMLVTDTEILIVDFKTNRPPPTRAEDVQDIYRKQMTAYAKAISKIYPNRIIRCALLWTDGPHLMEVPVQAA